jgi:hypothetical protein
MPSGTIMSDGSPMDRTVFVKTHYFCVFHFSYRVITKRTAALIRLHSNHSTHTHKPLYLRYRLLFLTFSCFVYLILFLLTFCFIFISPPSASTGFLVLTPLVCLSFLCFRPIVDSFSFISFDFVQIFNLLHITSFSFIIFYFLLS